MSRFFYAKLALNNLKKNMSLYIPYMLTAIGIICVFYTMTAIANDNGLSEMLGAAQLQMILGFGVVVVGIFATIFLFYTNSFLIKRRKKEFGLFNILGMEKRHIGRMMLIETVFISFFCLVIGFSTGIILYKLIFLLLLRITKLEIPFGFHMSFEALSIGLILFGIIFALTLLYNLGQVKLAKPIELIQSKNVSEKEPKTKWLIALIGILALAGGYTIALTTKNPITAIPLFFVAVVLVMIGTYTLFLAGSIALLKLLKKNKSYFYQTKHFIAVSGMIYRMKQNAVGLANICILSTAVLVMLSGTLSLYLGSKDTLDLSSPEDVNIFFQNTTKPLDDEIDQMIQSTIAEHQLEAEVWKEYRFLSLFVKKENEQITIAPQMQGTEMNFQMLSFITADQYQALTDKTVSLADDEILVHSVKGNEDERVYQIGDNKYQIKSYIDEFEMTESAVVSYFDSYCIVVKNEEVLSEIYQLQEAAKIENIRSISHEIQLGLSGSDQQIKECMAVLSEKFSQLGENYGDYNITIRSEMKANLDIIYGGFLFLGIFLGFVFLMATVLIIYYKQVSEGYEDKMRYEIMQKVGLSKKEVRATIRSQIIIIFFMPIIMAAVHLLAALPMIIRMISLFSIYNVSLIIICTLLTVLAFAVMYLVVYAMTAKVYYRIVNE